MDFVIVFPGETFMINFEENYRSKSEQKTLTLSYLESSYSLLVTSESADLYKNDKNKYKVLIKSLDVDQNSLGSYLISHYNQVPGKPQKILITVNQYPDSGRNKLIKLIMNTLDIFISLEIPSITITCTKSQSESFYSFLKARSNNNLSIYSLNENTKFELYDKIMCKVCRELPYTPYISLCCSNIYCERCANISHHCFDCMQSNMKCTEDVFLNSFFKDFTYKCKCGTPICFSEIKKHLFQCEFSIYKCKNCDFEGTQAEIVAHAILRHYDTLSQNIRNAPILGDINKECPECTNFYYGEICDKCNHTFSTIEEIFDKLSLN
jgi:hypothetical protein